MKLFNPINHPICFATPLRDAPSAWMKHIPFALYLIDRLHPKTFVELGTYLGTSYCAFCQAVKELGLETRCYAVDTWQGDPHGGNYGPEILADLCAHHDPRYGSFSQLIQSTFDEALPHFADGTIDLLHLDGYHTYEAVKHDFESWLPKMSERGVMLLHDTNERSGTFGVWKFFSEAKQRYPHFEFLHEHGLGMLSVGPCSPEPLREIFDAPEESWPTIREFFFQLGLRIEAAQQAQSELAQAQTQLENAQAYAKDLYAQVEAAQEAKAELEKISAYAKDLYVENERLHSSLEMASAEVALLHHSRGVRLIKLARAARRLLDTQGPMAATKQTLLWLGGKRGSYGKSLAVTVESVKPAPAATLPPKEWSVIERHLPSEAPFAGVSIVMPVFNALDYARACVESIYKAKGAVPFEVIVVDNGSQPEVLAWLKTESQQRERFFYLSLSHNLGFARAVNLGMEQARGQYLMIHNSDTVVTSGWLDHLISAAESDPELGIISPVTNYVGEGLQIDEAAVGMDVEEAERYAAKIKDRTSLIPIPDRLVFFSVLVKREVLVAVGRLDEGFGLGNFEDDDYCLRTRLAGFKLAIAQNVFVYHHGSKSFAANKIDHTAWMDQNRLWHLNKLSQLSTRWPPHVRRAKVRERGEVSVVMRTYNRPELLKIALTSLANQTLEAFEVVLVNDGGKDVCEIIRPFEESFPITYIQHTERKGMGAAQNAGVRATRGKWLAYLDDDDILYPSHLETLWATLERRHPGAHFAYSDYNRALLEGRNAGATTIARVPVPRWTFDRRNLLVENHQPINTWMHSRACLEEVGGFDENLIFFDDWDFQLRVAARYLFYTTQRLTCEYRFYLDGTNATVKRRDRQLEQLDQLYARHPISDHRLLVQRQEARELLKLQIAKVEKLRYLGEYQIVPPQEAECKVLSLVAGFQVEHKG